MSDTGYESPVARRVLPGGLRAQLALAIALVTVLTLAPLLGNHPPQALADTVRRAWTAFATTGNPGWPPYTPDRRTTRLFDVRPRVVEVQQGPRW